MRRLAAILALAAVVAGAAGCGAGRGEDLTVRPPAPPETPEVIEARKILRVHGDIFGEMAKVILEDGRVTPESDAYLTASLAPGPLRERVREGAKVESRRGFEKLRKDADDIWYTVVEVVERRDDCLIIVAYGDFGLFRRPNPNSEATRIDMIRDFEMLLIPANPADDPLGVNSSEWQLLEARGFEKDNRLGCPAPAS